MKESRGWREKCADLKERMDSLKVGLAHGRLAVLIGGHCLVNNLLLSNIWRF